MGAKTNQGGSRPLSDCQNGTGCSIHLRSIDGNGAGLSRCASYVQYNATRYNARLQRDSWLPATSRIRTPRTTRRTRNGNYGGNPGVCTVWTKDESNTNQCRTSRGKPGFLAQTARAMEWCVGPHAVPRACELVVCAAQHGPPLCAFVDGVWLARLGFVQPRASSAGTISLPGGTISVDRGRRSGSPAL
jgi:hypothetical protein